MNWWHYLLLVNFYLVLFFGFYALLLRRETFFQLNRVYLVAASLLSFFIPLIQADWVKDLFITQEVQQTIYGGPIAMVYNFTPSEVDNTITLGQILNAAYIAVTVFLVIRLLWQLLVLKKAIETPSPSAAYSFFKKISLGQNIARSGVINQHEQVHADQWHSLDVMIIEIVMIINWFNPVVYLYRFAIKYIHEFIADRQVIQSGTDKVDYAMLLLSQTFEVDNHTLVTPFYNHSLLKKRIIMLQKNRSQRIALAKYGLSAPLFILMLIFSSATVNNSKAVTVINTKTAKALLTPAADVVTIITDHSAISYKKSTKVVTDTVPKKDNKVFSQVETQPQFLGGLQAFGKFLADNIHYPAADRASKTEGRVIASFIVEADGTLSDIKALRSPTQAMGAEAVRVLTKSPRWKPGYQFGHAVRVSYTVPISFTLGAAPAPVTGAVTTGDDKGTVYTQVEKQPSFPGGLEAFGKFLSNTIRFPASDREAGTSGRVIVTFVVEKDGGLSGFKVVRTPSVSMGDESIRVLSLSPKWTPGEKDGKPVRVSYTVPIAFTLNEEKDERNTNSIDSLLKKKNIEHPIYIVDGVEFKPSEVSPLSSIPQESIASMEILKGATATALYGDKGKNGVILITTKNAKKATTTKP
ncbi:MAG: TonB family protein [Bacteroidota bacterium]